jgi:menaquinone-9 beta-reductase
MMPDPEIRQMEASALPDRLWDVAIAGAGPAGAMAALHLATAGHSVLLLDKSAFPREKVCGDGLIADAMACLRRAGLDETVKAHAHRAAEASAFTPWSGTPIAMPGDYWIIRRLVLDHLLAAGAVKRGASFSCGRVESVERGDGSGAAIRLAGHPQAIRARIVILATGADASLLKRLNMLTTPPLLGLAVRCYVRHPGGPAALTGYFDPSVLRGYGWIFPVEKDVFNIGFVESLRGGRPRDPRRLFSEFTRTFGPARRLMAEGNVLTPLKGAWARCGLAGALPVSGTILAAGECAGSTLPFTGEGIGTAMITGECAAACIHEALVSGDLEGLSGYSKKLEDRLRTRQNNHLLVGRLFSIPLLSRFLVRRIEKSPRLRGAALNMIHGDHKPGDILTLRRIIRALFR